MLYAIVNSATNSVIGEYSQEHLAQHKVEELNMQQFTYALIDDWDIGGHRTGGPMPAFPDTFKVWPIDNDSDRRRTACNDPLDPADEQICEACGQSKICEWCDFEITTRGNAICDDCAQDTLEDIPSDHEEDMAFMDSSQLDLDNLDISFNSQRDYRIEWIDWNNSPKVYTSASRYCTGEMLKCLLHDAGVETENIPGAAETMLEIAEKERRQNDPIATLAPAWLLQHHKEELICVAILGLTIGAGLTGMILSIL